MYICLCNAITDAQIRRAAKSGARDIHSLQKELGVAAGCGSCEEHAVSILRESQQAQDPMGFAHPIVYQPATA